MKILQKPVSETQRDAMFYHGVIAEGLGFKLETYQDGEVSFEEHTFIGADTPKLGEFDVHDVDLEAEVIADIYVDKFFAITKDGELVDEDDLVFNDYDEAMNAFEEYLRRFNKYNCLN